MAVHLRSVGSALVVTVALLASGCAPPSEPPPPDVGPLPVIGETIQVLPGPGIPTDVGLLQANNNLDVIEVGGSRWLGVRTSLVHFATPLTKLVIFRSDDGGTTWVTEAVVERGRDMREPRFLEIDGQLFFYFFEAGVNPFAFQPGRVFAMRRDGAGTWSAAQPISGEGSVVWRTKTVDGVPYMTRYDGGEDNYTSGEPQIEVRLLTTDDGFDWRPVDPTRPAVHVGGGSEADFAFDGDGRLWAVMRNDSGEAGRFGSLVCSAPPGDIANWDCDHDPRKFDSPLVFSHGGEVWLLARRQVANDGNYDLGLSGIDRDVEFLALQAAYWVTPKRLALWRIDRSSGRVEWVADLPSRGDTAFPGLVWEGPNQAVVYNYSSPIDGDDLAWVAGQLGPTNIYATRITFPPAP